MCGRLVNLDTVARVLAEYYHLKTDTQLAALNDALGRVPAETVGKELFGISEQLNDTISRAAVVDEIEGVDWYHINKSGEMVQGANPDDHQAWYKAEDIYKAVESVPSAQQWIPVTPKTLPKKVGNYLVTTYSGQIARYIYTGNGTSKDYWMRCALAWMPLPEPWKGEQE